MKLSKTFKRLSQELQNTKYLLLHSSELYAKEGFKVILPYGLGDTLLWCLFFAQIEERHALKITFLIKPYHVGIFRFFGLDNYVVTKVGNLPGRVLAFLNPWPKAFLRKNSLFWGHFLGHLSFRDQQQRFEAGELNLMDLYRDFLDVDVPDPKRLELFQKNSLLYEHKDLSLDLGKIILVCPAARTLSFQDSGFWALLIGKLVELGFDVIENGQQVYLHSASSKTELKLSLEDLLSIGFKCRKVISFRSGLSDLFMQREEAQTVVYPDQLSFKQYSLRNMFGVRAQEFVADSSGSLLDQVISSL